MAITLTKSYQKIATIKLTYGEIRTYAKYTAQDTVNNKTTYYLKSTYYVSSMNYVSFDSATAKLDGTSKSYGYTKMQKGETIIQEVQRTVNHNNDGSSPTKSVKTEWSATFGGGGTSTASIVMPKINRLATITSATDFTDEENPIIKFNNPAGFSVYPYLNFYDDNNELVYQLIRNSVSATSPYEWNITTEERNALWLATNKQKKYTVTVGVDTYNNTTKLGYDSKPQIMSYVNAEPTQSTTFTEQNQKVIDVLNSSSANTLIQNASVVKLETTPTMKKKSTVEKVLFEHNNISIPADPSSYNYSFVAKNSKFKVTVIDSRGYSVSTEYTKDVIEYLPINIDNFSFKRENPTSSNIKLNAQISYKQTSFNSVNNAPTIAWKMAVDGQLNTLTADDYVVDSENNTITISNLMLSNILPYKQDNRFYLYANDLLTKDEENLFVTKGIPTFDAGEHDFQVNGTLNIADENRENIKTLLDYTHPVGEVYTTTNESFNPNSYWGGTWEKLTADAYFKIVTSNAGQLDGTSSEHKIPLSSMPKHNHATQGYIRTHHNIADGAQCVARTKISGDPIDSSVIQNTGGGEAYYPYYYGVYAWLRKE